MTLRERKRRGPRPFGVYTLALSFLLADRMHPFLAIYDLQPLKMHPLVFAPGVPVTAQVVGTERYTSGSKVPGLAPMGQELREDWLELGAVTQPGNIHSVPQTPRWEPALCILSA